MRRSMQVVERKVTTTSSVLNFEVYLVGLHQRRGGGGGDGSGCREVRGD